MKLLFEAIPHAEATQKYQKEKEEADERDMVANKKNDIAIQNMIKIN